jgi:hypothetical protein
MGRLGKCNGYETYRSLERIPLEILSKNSRRFLLYKDLQLFIW